MEVKETVRRLDISSKLVGITIRLIKIEYALKNIERCKNEIVEMVAEISQLNLKED